MLHNQKDYHYIINKFFRAENSKKRKKKENTQKTHKFKKTLDNAD